jgi:asparagine synthase (glutamine-hydrolysing)
MLGRLAHRGPDDQRIAAHGDGVVGARRLAIIDLQHGAQPMANEDGSVLAVQNGEIYNFESLRAELIAFGHLFHTRNDTEVLPHAYEEWGPGLVERLHGMFAIAIWDGRRGTLLLARDRFGKKPLVYAQLPDVFLFASEIQALLAHPLVPRDVDAAAIDQYLTLGYVAAPLTAFAGIRKVEPAHTLTVSGGRAEVPRRYWRIVFGPKLRISARDAAEELRARIDEAVRIRLMSDVPIGAFLSGGLDSSTVVAYMAKNMNVPVKTFSIGFRARANDERAFARMVASAFETEHHEFVVDAEQTDDLPMLARHLGEPFADSSIVPSYHVARVTRASVTVALNGDGGDELFAGYDRYKAAALAHGTLDRLPPRTLGWLSGGARRLPAGSRLPRTYLRGRRFLLALGLAPEPRFLRWTGYFTGELHDAIAGERLRERAFGAPTELLRQAGELTGATEPAERYMASDILMNLPGDLLVKMDIASMAASLETRSPLLDHTLAEFVARLPLDYKLSVRTSKVLLRRAMTGVLPSAVVRRGKMGFMAPVGAWLRGPLRPMFEDLVLGATADRGYISRSIARSLFHDHLHQRADRAPLLWNLLMLELWFRECVESASARVPDNIAGIT